MAAQAVAATAHYVNGTGRPFFGFEQLKAQFGELGAVAATAHYVNGTGRPFFGFEQLKAQFGELGVTVTERAKHEVSSTKPKPQQVDDGEAREFHIQQYCFKFEGSTTCTKIPVLTHLRTAA